MECNSICQIMVEWCPWVGYRSKGFGKKSTNATSENKLTSVGLTGVLCVLFIFVNCLTHIFHARKIYQKLMYIHMGPFYPQEVSCSTSTSISLPVTMILRTRNLKSIWGEASDIHKKIDSFLQNII